MSSPELKIGEHKFTPWQPGPWEIADHGVIDANGKHVHRDPCGPNVKLESLAPEMATAILDFAWAASVGDVGDDEFDEAYAALTKLAARLEAIR